MHIPHPHPCVGTTIKSAANYDFSQTVRSGIYVDRLFLFVFGDSTTLTMYVIIINACLVLHMQICFHAPGLCETARGGCLNLWGKQEKTFKRPAGVKRERNETLAAAKVAFCTASLGSHSRWIVELGTCLSFAQSTNPNCLYGVYRS